MPKIIDQQIEVHLDKDPVDILKKLEKIARTCYKSEDRITDDSYFYMMKMLLTKKHLSILEHESITVRYITNRAVTHELVRHRLASFAQESQRYVNYSIKNDGHISFIKPFFIEEPDSEAGKIWIESIKNAENAYKKLIEIGCSPQEARDILPNCAKTEIVITANLREWRYILDLRSQDGVYPPLRDLMKKTIEIFKENIPIIFDDIGE
jgi:thymidylate synthase (FAD)